MQLLTKTPDRFGKEKKYTNAPSGYLAYMYIWSGKGTIV